MTEPTNAPADVERLRAELDETRGDLDKARELIDRNWPEPNITQIRVERDAARTRAGVAETELATAREALEALKRHEWFVGKAAKARAAQHGTVADLTERLVAASSEWDDLTGDDEGPTSRPYLEHLAKAVESWRPAPAEPGAVADAVRQLRAQTPVAVQGVDESAEDYHYRQAYARICDWLEYEYKPAPVPADAGTSTLPRHFVAPDGHAEPTIWQGTGPDDPNCQPIVRKCTLDGEDPVLWPTVVQALTGAGDSTADETAETLQRVINDLHAVAATLNPEGIADPEDISHEDKVKADVLIEYAQRLRKHPALAQGGAS